MRDEAFASTKAFFDSRQAIRQTGTAAADTSKSIDQLAERQEKAAKASQNLAREQEKLADAQRKALEQLRTLSAKATADTLTDEQRSYLSSWESGT